MPIPRQRRGFSLVLSLTIMALMVLVVLSVVGFLSIESRLSANHQLQTQARLSGVAALRLALAHLQQEAGPDRRVTARADLTADATQPGWKWTTIRNPMWTGVWRSDKPAQPPAWLVSGRHDATPGIQSLSLSGKTDYDANQWVPWQSDYAPTVATATLVTLVGDATATPAEDATAGDPGRPDGRVTLPAIASPDAAARMSYAYWIGDEGIKAKANLVDARLASASAATVRSALRGTGRNGMELITGLEGTAADTTFSQVTQHGELPLLRNTAGTVIYNNAAVTGAAVLPWRRSQADITFWSNGILADSFWGGLRIDLSQAFEQGDADFLSGDFGEGGENTTLLFWNMNKTLAADPPVMGFTNVGKIWMPVWYTPANTDGTLSNTATRFDVGALYTHNWDDPDNAPNRGGLQVRGPSWMVLRDYHLLYRQLAWTSATPTLRARTHFPNVISNEKMQVGTGGTYHTSHIFNRMDNTNLSSIYGDPCAVDISSGPFGYSSFASSPTAAAHGGLGSGTPCIRPVKVAATPYISRQLVVLGLQQSSGQVRLTISPISVLHNPYNVAMVLSNPVPTDPAPKAGMRLSFRFWDSWSISMSQSGSSGVGSWSRSLLAMANALDATANGSESLRTYIPADTVLQPGEFRVFTAAPRAPVPFSRIANTSNSYDQLSGFWVPCLNSAGGVLTPAADDSLTIGFNTGGFFYVRHLMTSANEPRDSIAESDNSRGDGVLYNRCSEVTELFDSALNPARNGTAAARVYGAGYIATLPAPGSAPSIFAVLDYSVRWPKDALPYPVFTHSNPLALMTRGDATGWPPSGAGTAYATTSPSYRMTVRSANTWPEVFEPGDLSASLALGGASGSSGLGGRTRAVVSELPLRPPTSLAQYAHANFGLRDQDPLYCIGSSFASPNLPLDKVVHYRPAQNWTDCDRAYLANMGVWDRYFLSSAGPEVSPGAAYSEARSMSKVLDDFIAGTAPLANPRMRLWTGRDNQTAAGRAALTTAVKGHRTIAGHITVDGAFNVNSTSVDAWAAVLGGTKRIPNGSSETAAAATNARFPRSERTDAAATTPKASWLSENAWSGFASLDDAQLRALARSIVDEIRFRTQYAVRTPVDRQLSKGGATEFPARRFRGATAGTTVLVPTPFLGLSQFVNRFLDTTSPANAVAKSGCLQAAIARADADNAEVSTRATPAQAIDRNTLAGGAGSGGQQSWAANPEGIETYDAGTRSAGIAARTATNQAHAALFAPGAVLQQDILAAIGPHITARSDTFVIRAYADARAVGGDIARGRVWIEAVVQRTPDFCNPANPPETPMSSLTDSTVLPINRLLGRRLRIVSVRWLGPAEL